MYPLLQWIDRKLISHLPAPFRKAYSFCLRLYEKQEEALDYLIFGALAFFINMIAYVFCARLLHVQYMLSTAIAWVAAVLFAYWSNRKFVFKSKVTDAAGLFREFATFIGGRIFTGILQMLMVFVIVDVLHGNDVLANLLGNIMAIIVNYILSKLLIFRKKHDRDDTGGK